MLELADWLQQHVPAEDSSGATSGLVHGDFRMDNLVFHPVEVLGLGIDSYYIRTIFLTNHFLILVLQDRVIGILDWELSTLGNQMCDVAYSSLVLLFVIINIRLSV